MNQQKQEALDKWSRDVTEAESDVAKLEIAVIGLQAQVKVAKEKLAGAQSWRSGLIRDRTPTLFGQED